MGCAWLPLSHTNKRLWPTHIPLTQLFYFFFYAALKGPQGNIATSFKGELSHLVWKYGEQKAEETTTSHVYSRSQTGASYFLGTTGQLLA